MPAATDGLPSIHAARLREVGAAFLRLRPWVTGPAMAVALAVLWFTELPAVQRTVIHAGFAAMFSFFAVEAFRLRGEPIEAGALFRSLLATQLGLSLACLASGAMRSPFLPLLFAPSVTAFAAFGRRRESTVALVLFFAAVALLAADPLAARFPPIPWPQRGWLLALFTCVSLVLLRLSVARLSDALARTAERLAQAHETVVAATEGRAQALEAVGARVAHEIKNPLAAVKGLVELLARDPRDEKEARRFAVVREEVERIEGLVRDYLSFSRPLAAPQPAPFDLAELVHGCCAILEARAHRASVALAVDGAPLVLRADARRLKEALLNLVGNAIEASPAGGTVRIRFRRDEGLVELEVRDDGAGMDARTLAAAGTPFFTTRPEGTGLGVALARAVIAQHGGTLRFDSSPGGGTAALVQLPLEC